MVTLLFCVTHYSINKQVHNLLTYQITILLAMHATVSLKKMEAKFFTKLIVLSSVESILWNFLLLQIMWSG